MTIVSCTADIFFPESSSRKTKRHLLKSLTTRLRNKFNITVAAMDGHDLWQRSVVGFAVAANETNNANEVLSKVIRDIERETQVEFLDYNFEVK